MGITLKNKNCDGVVRSLTSQERKEGPEKKSRSRVKASVVVVVVVVVDDLLLIRSIGSMCGLSHQFKLITHDKWHSASVH